MATIYPNANAALEGLLFDGMTIAAGIGSGLESVLAPTLVLGLSALSAWKFGAASGIAGGEKLAFVVWTMSTLACSAYVLSVGKFGIIADTARGIAQMSSADAEVKRRTARLDDAGFIAAAVAQTHLILVSTLSALLVATALPMLVKQTVQTIPSAQLPPDSVHRIRRGGGCGAGWRDIRQAHQARGDARGK